MTTLLTSDLIERCHQGSLAKGFWDETPPQGQQLMLVISELAESLEAHRKGLQADFPLYQESLERVELMVPDQHKEEAWARTFVACLKDSVGDELADTYIQLCDFIGGYKLDQQLVLISKCDPSTWVLPSNFGEAILLITESVVDVNKQRRRSGGTGMEVPLSDVLTNIEVLAAREGIDLATHIDLKLRYNATRGYKHEKAY